MTSTRRGRGEGCGAAADDDSSSESTMSASTNWQAVRCTDTSQLLEVVAQRKLNLIVRVEVLLVVPAQRRVETIDWLGIRASRLADLRQQGYLARGRQHGAGGQLDSSPARVEQVQKVEDLELDRPGVIAHAGKALPNRQIGQMHPGRAAAVPRHDRAALLTQTARAIDEALECELLSRHVRRSASEHDLLRIERRTRDVDRVVANRSVGIEIAATLRPARDVSVWKARAAHVEEPRCGLEPPPGRAKGAGHAHAKRLIEIRCPEPEVVLETRNGTRVAPVVDEECTHRARALHVPRDTVVERCGDVGQSALPSQHDADVVRMVARLVREEDDVAELGRDAPRSSRSRRADRPVHHATVTVGGGRCAEIDRLEGDGAPGTREEALEGRDDAERETRVRGERGAHGLRKTQIPIDDVDLPRRRRAEAPSPRTGECGVGDVGAELRWSARVARKRSTLEGSGREPIRREAAEQPEHRGPPGEQTGAAP